MRRAVPASANIGALVNTHSNGDHCWGNSCWKARASSPLKPAQKRCSSSPEVYAQVAEGVAFDGIAGKFWWEVMARASTITASISVPRTKRFRRDDAACRRQEVKLIEVGPAHTRGTFSSTFPRIRSLTPETYFS